MTYRKHQESPVVVARDAIRAAVEQTQRERMEAKRKLARRRAITACSTAAVLVAATAAVLASGYSIAWLIGIGIVVLALVLFLWLGSGLEPHGDNPPLRHG